MPRPSECILFDYKFYPVGQGLFATGALEHQRGFSEGMPRVTSFRWIHDCGAAKFAGVDARDREIQRYHDEFPKGELLDLLIISHFDEDHVNGLKKVLAGIRVRQIVLPYLAPAERLFFANDGGGGPPDPEHFDFLIDPTRALREIAGPEARVRYITGGEGDITEAGEDNRLSGDGPTGFPDENSDENVGEAGDPALQGGRVTVTRGGRPYAAVSGRWEFCFHNRDNPRATPALRDEVKAALAAFQLLAKPDFEEFRRVFRAIYDKHIGKTKEDRNDISLITYTGPIAETRAWLNAVCWDACWAPPDINYQVWRFLDHGWWTPPQTLGAWPVGLLYTGDVTMDDALANQVWQRFGRRRWDKIVSLQVPHHGARDSWGVKNLAVWRQRWSVFCADPTFVKYGHPHKEVWYQLRAHGPALVDKKRGLYFCGMAWWH